MNPELAKLLIVKYINNQFGGLFTRGISINIVPDFFASVTLGCYSPATEENTSKAPVFISSPVSASPLNPAPPSP